MKDDDGPAFPVSRNRSFDEETGDLALSTSYVSSGLSVRDWFAGMALQGLLSNDSRMPWATAASEAYEYADAMIEERKK